MPADQNKYWLGFSLIHGIGSSRLRSLYHYFQQDLETAWHASPTELKNAGLSASLIENLTARRSKLNLQGSLKRLGELGAKICSLDDSFYPRRLAEIADAPPMFYFKGELLPQDEQAIAMVGTRRASAYGRTTATALALSLARAGITIVSGLAVGIDALAHQAALDAGGRTLAVLGNGIDTIYPKQNEALAKSIVERGQGAIISEYPPRTHPNAKHFPARNRIISGLSLGVLVVEAPASSGALLTASIAAEQGREIFAVPGNINAPTSHGTNKLIQDGAKIVTQVEDILDDLNLSHQLIQTQQMAQDASPSDDTEAALLRIIADGALHIDEISVLSGLSIQEVSARMMILALKKLVNETHPLTYSLVRKLP